MATKVIAIDDFSGGKNIYDNQALIANNQCSSASFNVWAPRKLLTKMAGFTILLSTSASANGGGAYNNQGAIFADDTVNSSYQLYHFLSFANAFNTATANDGYGFWGGQSDSLIPLGYNVGTISISGASLISATGSGTSWTTNIVTGDLLVINTTSSAYYTIASVEDNTHLTLNGALPIAVATGSAYNICLKTKRLKNAVHSFIGSLWISTTGDSLQRYDGTKMTRISGGPAAAFMAVYQNYLFAARTSTATSRLYWSAIKDPTSWPANNFIDIDKDKGLITGIYSYQNELLIFKSRSLYKVVGSIFDSANPTYAVYPIAVPSYFMFNSSLSISVYKEQLIFFADNHLFTYRPGTFYITNISGKYYEDFSSNYKSLNDLDGALGLVSGINFHNNYILNAMQYSSLQLAGGILDGNGAWWWFVDSNGPSPVYNVGAWGSFSMVIRGSSATNPAQLIVGDTNVGRAYIWNIIGPSYTTSTISSPTGLALAIDGQWYSKEFNIEYGTFKRVVVYLQKQSAGNLSVQWKIDQGTFVVNTVDMTKGRGTIIRAVLPVNQKGSTIQLFLNNSVISQNFNIYGIKIYYEDSESERLL